MTVWLRPQPHASERSPPLDRVRDHPYQITPVTAPHRRARSKEHDPKGEGAYVPTDLTRVTESANVTVAARQKSAPSTIGTIMTARVVSAGDPASETDRLQHRVHLACTESPGGRTVAASGNQKIGSKSKSKKTRGRPPNARPSV